MYGSLVQDSFTMALGLSFELRTLSKRSKSKATFIYVRFLAMILFDLHCTNYGGLISKGYVGNHLDDAVIAYSSFFFFSKINTEK